MKTIIIKENFQIPGTKIVLEKGDKIQIKENSLTGLKDPKMVDDIVEFIKKNPFPKDHEQFHTWAEKKGYEAKTIEECIYAMLTIILCGGKSKGKKIDISAENKKIGEQIELEHVDYDSDNPVVKRIQEIFIEKIYLDHTAEMKDYYQNELFKKELEKENK